MYLGCGKEEVYFEIKKERREYKLLTTNMNICSVCLDA